MDAAPILNRVASAFAKARLEAVMIGNAAAALQGAPVTTMDIDFMVRETRRNVEKLKEVAEALDAAFIDADSPVTSLRKIEREDEGLYLDFLTTVDGVKSFESLRSRASKVDFDGSPLWVAALEDIIASKRATHRSKDLAALELLEKTLDEKRQQKERD